VSGGRDASLVVNTDYQRERSMSFGPQCLSRCRWPRSLWRLLRYSLRHSMMGWLALGLLAATHEICVAAPAGAASDARTLSSASEVSTVRVGSSAQWPAALPARLTVGILEGGWPPFDIPQDGRLAGVSGDLLRALVGPNVVIETKTYPDMAKLLEAACAGQVDLLTSVARTPKRERCLSFTVPYFHSFASAVVRRDDTRYENPARLAGVSRSSAVLRVNVCCAMAFRARASSRSRARTKR
jgi:two-component system, NarL family, sensor histidine kinase EvgS